MNTSVNSSQWSISNHSSPPLLSLNSTPWLNLSIIQPCSTPRCSQLHQSVGAEAQTLLRLRDSERRREGERRSAQLSVNQARGNSANSNFQTNSNRAPIIRNQNKKSLLLGFTSIVYFFQGVLSSRNPLFWKSMVQFHFFQICLQSRNPYWKKFWISKGKEW